MKEFDNVLDIAKYFNLKQRDVLDKYEEQGWMGKFFLGDKEIKIESLDNKLKYVYVDEKNDKDCKEYLLKYEVNKYDWKVYVDDLEGWQNCKVLNIDNKGFDIRRATVETEYGSKINRLVNYAMDKEELVPNRCVFMMEKEDKEKEYDENDFYTTKGKVLLATNYRGGYFLNPETNKVENIVYKKSGYGNCIMGSLDYMKRLIESEKIKGIKLDYDFTEEGKKLLNIDRKKSLNEVIMSVKNAAKEKEIKFNKTKEER